MKSYIPHRLLVITDQITKDAQDSVMERCYRLVFDWANKMGMNGKKVFDLFIERPNFDKDPMNVARTYMWCKIECTEDERKTWEEQQKLNIEHYVLTALSEA